MPQRNNNNKRNINNINWNISEQLEMCCDVNLNNNDSNMNMFLPIIVRKDIIFKFGDRVVKEYRQQELQLSKKTKTLDIIDTFQKLQRKYSADLGKLLDYYNLCIYDPKNQYTHFLGSNIYDMSDISIPEQQLRFFPNIQFTLQQKNIDSLQQTPAPLIVQPPNNFANNFISNMLTIQNAPRTVEQRDHKEINQQTRIKREKERNIGFAIDKVSEWRYIKENGYKNDKGEWVSGLTQELAAKYVGMSKKTLEDYNLQLKKAQQRGFCIESHKQQKMGVLRRFNKDYEQLEALQKQNKNYQQQNTEEIINMAKQQSEKEQKQLNKAAGKLQQQQQQQTIQQQDNDDNSNLSFEEPDFSGINSDQNLQEEQEEQKQNAQQNQLEQNSQYLNLEKQSSIEFNTNELPILENKMSLESLDFDQNNNNNIYSDIDIFNNNINNNEINDYQEQSNEFYIDDNNNQIEQNNFFDNSDEQQQQDQDQFNFNDNEQQNYQEGEQQQFQNQYYDEQNYSFNNISNDDFNNDNFNNNQNSLSFELP